MSPNQHKRVLSGTAGEQDEMRKIMRIDRECNKPHWTGAALLREAQKLYKNELLKWRCPEQERAMRLFANGTPEVLLVLATGSRKSLPFMLGSSLPGARTTIVIVPLVLLRLDLLRRCKELGLNPVVWSSAGDVVPGMDGASILLFVSVEVAARHTFRQFARRLYDTGNLDRSMIDECHLIHTSAHYRRHMAQLNELRQFNVPFVYMTATLPSRLEEELFRRHHISTASIVRGCTKRPNVRYGVEYLRVPKGEGLTSFTCRTIVQRWEDRHRAEWKDARVMIFVRSCADAEEVAKKIGCSYYHREIGTTEEKETRLRDWMSGESGSPFLACTTAAGAGVGYAHVRWVVHIEDPYGLINFAQESGLGGRDEEAAGSTVFMKREPRLASPPTPLDHADPTDQEAINEYLRGLQCRRMCLAQELDEAKYRQTCGESDMECDTCEARREQGIASTDPPETTLRQGTMLECSDDNVAEEAEDESKNGVAMRYRRRQIQDQFEMDEYLRRLSQMKGYCIICRTLTPGVD